MQKKEGDWGPGKPTATHPRVCHEYVVHLGACSPRLLQKCAVMALAMSFGTLSRYPMASASNRSIRPSLQDVLARQAHLLGPLNSSIGEEPELQV